MSNTKMFLRVFYAWLALDLVFLAIGMQWRWFFDIGARGLLPDLLLGILLLGQYLHDNGKL